MTGITWIYALFYLWSTANLSAPVRMADNELANQRHLYDSNAEIHCQFQSITYENTTKGHLKISSPRSNYDVNDYLITYQTTKASRSKSQSDTLSTDRLSPTLDGSFITTLSWPDLIGGSLYLTITNKSSGASWEYEWSILKGDPLILKNEAGMAIFENYISNQDSFQIESADPGITTVHLYQYEHNFDAARPPISSRSRASGRNLSIDSVWSIKVGQKMAIKDAGLYFVQSDSSSLEGISFRITEASYPRPGKIQSLVAPLKYITTKSEFQQLQSAEDPKKAFDKFWLEQTNDEQLARKNIRAYFQRLTWCNQIFTNYKEGWKTDRGMIYIIFGLPQEVRRLPDREEWTYPSFNNSEVVFTFMRVPNIFTDQHYELVRSSDYDDYWFATLDAWRRGGLTR